MKGLSDKYRFYIYLAGFLIILAICYNVALKSTIQSARNCRNMKEKAQLAVEMPQKAANLRSELATLNSTYFDEVKGLTDAHELVLERLSKLSSQFSTSVIGYPEKHLFENSFIRTETHTALLKGSFKNLLLVIYHLEVSEKVGRIASFEFFSEIDNKTRITNLYLRIYIQNYRNLKKNESQ